MDRILLMMLIATGFVFGTAQLAQAMNCHESHASKPADHKSHGALAAAPVNAGNKICPVSEQEIGQSGMEPATYEYQGKVYNFCCAMCIDEFKKDPDKYIKKVEKEKGE